MKCKRRWFTRATLLATMVASLAGNLWLGQLAYMYYVNGQSARLDPLDLRVFPPDATSTPDGDASSQPLLVFFGDSRAADWPAPSLPTMRVLNRGIGGQTSAQVAGRYQAHVAPLRPTFLVVQVGINDLRNIPLLPERSAAIRADFQANINRIIAEARRTNTIVILSTIVPRGELAWTRQIVWSAAVDEAVVEANSYLLSLRSADVFVLDTAALLSNDQGIVADTYRRDSLHVNQAAYARLNEALVQLVQSLR